MSLQNNVAPHNLSLPLCDDAAKASHTLVIIPTFNEADNIGKLIDYLKELYQIAFDILVID